jgi:diaminopimelate epimerase
MKGIAQYILILLVTAFVTIFSFYLLSQLLSKEEEVSTISRIFASSINKMEYSKVYFIKMIENEYSLLKGNLQKEEIANRLKKKYKVEMGDVVTDFEVRKVSIEKEALKLEVLQKSVYSNPIFPTEANDTFILYLK